MNDDIEKVQPFDSFSAVYKILGWAGYYRLNKPTSGFKRIFHQIYRMLAFLIPLIYNVQHLIFAVQNRYHAAKLMNCLMIEIPQINLLTKVWTVFFLKSRIDRVNIFLRDDPAFRASDKECQSILLQNKQDMHRLCRLLMTSISIATFVWPSSFIVKRYNDADEGVPSYMPFATDTWPKFFLSVFCESGPMLWVGYGHLALDTLFSTHYAHAQAQLKILKYQLENFLNNEEQTVSNHHFRYRDCVDKSILNRFISIVKRYEKLLWYHNEISAIFNFPMSFQFFTTTTVVCLVIYNMTTVRVVSLTFLFLVVLFCILLMQVFVYCYFGNLLEFESRFVNTSLYNSDWISLSPPFRRQLLIAMQRWSRSIQPRVCYIIPLSLNTFISIVKSSYTLYTVLVTTRLNDV